MRNQDVIFFPFLLFSLFSLFGAYRSDFGCTVRGVRTFKVFWFWLINIIRDDLVWEEVEKITGITA